MPKNSNTDPKPQCVQTDVSGSLFGLISKEIENIKKNIYYNIHDKNKKPIKILRIDISGKLPIADFIEAERVSLLTCLGELEIHSIYLHYLLIHPDYR